jgi:hypothetical protein
MTAPFVSFRGAVCAAALLVAMSAHQSSAGEAEIAFPQVIICELKGVRYFAYLDRIDAEGNATYMTPSGQFARISSDGTVVRSGQAAEGSCAGKSLEQLRAGGQTLSLHK